VAVAVPLWLGAAKQAPAQSTPAITPGTRNFQATMILQANLQQGANAQRQAVIAPAYQRPHRTGPAVRFSAAAPLTIVISTPPASPLDPRQPTEYANIRGPGGDVRRIAWIDGAQRVLKLVRERADGAVVEEWFDESGRLREALVRARAGGGSWTRHVTLGEHGEENSQDASDTGLAPEAPPPPLVRRDPSAAFFSGAGCAAPAKP